MKIDATPKTFISIAIFLAVFGNLGYQIVKDSTRKEVKKSNTTVQKYEPKSEKDKKEPYSLQPISRDPFLGTITTKKVIAKKVNNKKPEVASWPAIQYSGLVAASAGRTKIFVISINGQQQLFKINDQVNGVQLVGGDKERVIVRFEGETKEFSI